MEGLQRSEVSFRRQGSSGLVWDDKFLSGELNRLADQQKQEKINKSHQRGGAASTTAAANSSGPPGLTIERNQTNGGRGYRTGRVPAAREPPSPRVSACGLCGAFGGKKNTRPRPPKSGKRVMWEGFFSGYGCCCVVIPRNWGCKILRPEKFEWSSSLFSNLKNWNYGLC